MPNILIAWIKGTTPDKPVATNINVRKRRYSGPWNLGCNMTNMARDGCQHEDGKRSEIGASDPGVSAGKVLLAEQGENGRNEVGIDVDRLIVDIQQTVQRSLKRA
ncbi:hypothetical protein FOIG_16530 [Fusarium odoratissimum NRRL 54006]|uniref:Uncharacterized protein n=1 Tax=Fusarium odoratissimum (strain NRRL 54006) TaxID=1089451 RepID=X0IMX1_FUSO5|nr:uncharacterized protein FOIG_16530 [Fusarium odoratissimum NRRL 54006]EXL90212.1 hypothetical protein FOIG_16530 [Fusarium odoratissimum NRRL 54006]